MLPISGRARRSILAVATAAASAAVAAPAMAADGSFTLQGVKGPGDTCAFTATLELAPGQASVETQQTGFDPATCTITMTRVTPGAATANAPGLKSLSAPASQAGAGAPAAIRESAGYSQSWLTNASGVKQNLVRNGVDYLYDGVHVGHGVCSQPYFEWNTNWWYAPIYDGRGKCLYNYTKTKITASSKVNFDSPAGAYCSYANDIWYNRHKTIGLANGTIKDQVSFAGSSGCLSALFLHQSVIRTV